MKGFTRKLDDLGRICIPKEYRKNYFKSGEIEIVATPQGILLKEAEVKQTREISVILDEIEEEMEKVKLTNTAVYTGLNIARKAVLGEL